MILVSQFFITPFYTEKCCKSGWSIYLQTRRSKASGLHPNDPTKTHWCRTHSPHNAKIQFLHLGNTYNGSFKIHQTKTELQRGVTLTQCSDSNHLGWVHFVRTCDKVLLQCLKNAYSASQIKVVTELLSNMDNNRMRFIVSLVPHRKLIVQENNTKCLVPHQDSEKGENCAAELAVGGGLSSRISTRWTLYHHLYLNKFVFE